MSQWGNNDVASNSVIWGPANVQKTANTANRDALFGNTTPGAFISGQATGVFGVSRTELDAGAPNNNNSIAALRVTFPGSGYSANATVTVTGNATANATANATGKISALNITAVGNSYSSAPTVTIAAPTAKTFNANTAVDATADFIAIATSPFTDNDLVTYTVSAGNTALTNLTSGSRYYVVSSNSTGVKLSLERGGTAIDLTKGLTETGHSLQGETATGIAITTSTAGIKSPGWNLRREGTGGRAGRVTYEPLVAMKGMTGDAENTVIKG